MARIKAKESELKYQLKLFKSRDEIEREEIEKAKEKAKIKAEEWLSAMEDFFSPSEEEVEKVLGLRNERLARLETIRKATTELMLRTERKYITGTKIKVIGLNVLNVLRITRLNTDKGLNCFKMALELIAKTRLELSSSEFRVQERKYTRGKREKVKKVIRPPPLKKNTEFVDRNGTFLKVKKIFKQKNCIFSLFVVQLKCKKFLFL